MDEKVLQDLFNRAVSKGYNKSIEEFTVLLSQNNDVLIDNFNYVKGKGYKKTIEDFKTLTGVVEGVKTTEPEVKKKVSQPEQIPEFLEAFGTSVVDEPVSTSQEEVTESVTPTEQEEVGSLESSAPNGDLNYDTALSNLENLSGMEKMDMGFLNGQIGLSNEEILSDPANVKKLYDLRPNEIVEPNAFLPSKIKKYTEEEVDEQNIVIDDAQILINQNNRDLLDSVGYGNKGDFNHGTYEPPTNRILNDQGILLDSEYGTSKEKSYYVRDNNTGEYGYKRAQDIDDDILSAIVDYENSKFSSGTKESRFEKKTLGNGKSIINLVSDYFFPEDEEKKVELTQEDISNPDNTSSIILDELGIDETEFLKWRKQSLRDESGGVYKFLKNITLSQEEKDYMREERDYEILQSYQMNLLNELGNDLVKNRATQNLSLSKEELIQLKKEEKEIIKNFKSITNNSIQTIELFPTYKSFTQEPDKLSRKRLHEAVMEGGMVEFGAGSIQVAKAIGTGSSSFILDFAAGIPGFFDQRLASLGFDDKGVLAGLSELLSDRARIFETQEGETKRTFAQEGKPVLYRGEEYIVDSYGRVYSEKSNILLEGIIPENEYKEIQKRASNVTEEVTNMTGGTFITGAANQAVQLVGLIRSGGAIKKSLGLKGPMAGNIGMGISSFTSGVVNNVDDIRSQLMATGMSEKEAMTIAVNAGQAISSLDGIFSGIAGSNEKLLSAAEGIKQSIVKLAVTKGKDFTRKEFVQKAKEMGIETLKEQAEELLVLKSEKVINALVNDSIGKEVLDTETTKSEYYETVLMTLGVTTTLGTVRLMSGLDRSQLVRTLAKNVNDLEKPLKELVKEGSLTKEQAAKTYAEVYSMQAAELKTKGTIIMPDNVEEAADLLTERMIRKGQREGLEGPLKEAIDKRIKDIDEQIKALQVRDKAEYEKVKTEAAPVAQAETVAATKKEAGRLKRRVIKAKEDFYAATDIGEKAKALINFLNNATISEASVSQEDMSWYEQSKSELEAEGYVFDGEIGREVSDNEITEIKNRKKSDQVPKGVVIIDRIVKPRRIVDGKQTGRPIYDVIEGTGTTAERDALAAEVESIKDSMTPQNMKETTPKLSAARKALKDYDADNFTSPIQTEINTQTETTPVAQAEAEVETEAEVEFDDDSILLGNTNGGYTGVKGLVDENGNQLPTKTKDGKSKDLGDLRYAFNTNEDIEEFGRNKVISKEYTDTDRDGKTYIIAKAGFEGFGGRTGAVFAAVPKTDKNPKNIKSILELKALETWVNQTQLANVKGRNGFNEIKPIIEKRIAELKTEIEEEAEKAKKVAVEAKPAVETEVKAEVETESEVETEEDILSELDELKVEVEAEQKGSLMDNIDKKVRIDGKDGVIKIDDENENTIVVETDDGQIIELGRKDEIGDNTLGSENISIIPSESEEFLSELDDMKVSEEESSKPDDVVTIDGVDVKVIGRRRDKKGKAVVRVKEVESGLERRIIGEQAEVILKDEALRKEKKPEKLKLTVEGKEKPRTKRKKKSKKKSKEEFDNKTLEELESMEKQLEEDTKAFEEMALEEAAAKSTNQDIVQVGGNIYQVTKKKDGSYTVSQMRADGKLVPSKDKKVRGKVIGAFKSKKSNKERKAINDAEKLINEFKDEGKDRILDFLDKAISSTSSNGRAFDATIGIPMFAVNSSLKIVRASYKAGKTIVEAIQDSLKQLKKQGYTPNEAKYKKYVVDALSKETTPKQQKSVEADKPTKRQKKTGDVIKQVDNARKSLAKLDGDVKIVLHNDEISYRNATNQKGRKKSSRGEYNPETKTIHINGTKANANTVAHEVFHALLLRKGFTNKQAKAITDRMLKAVKKTASPELLEKLEEFSSNYESSLQSEESISELFGILASEYENLDVPTQNLIQRWVNKLAKLFKVKLVTDSEIINFLNVVSAKVQSGEQITDKDVEILESEKSDIGKANKRFQDSFSDTDSGMTYMYDVATDKFKKIDEKYITRDKSISDFDNVFMILHQPDAAFSGQIRKGDEVLVEGKGGVFYPIKFHEKGYFWASTSKAAEGMAEAMNKSLKDNGGKIYLALTTAPIDKVLSSTNAANGVMDLFISLSSDKKLKIRNIRSTLINAYNQAFDDNIKANTPIEEVKTKIKKRLAPNKSVFNERKKFSDAIIGLVVESMGDSKTNQEAHNRLASIFGEGMMAEDLITKFKSGSKVSKEGLIRAVSQMLSEPILRDVDSKNGSIYAVLEIEGEVEAVDAVSKDDHESYPKAIKSKGKSKTTLHLLTDRVKWQDVTIDPKTKDTVNKSEKVLSKDPKKAKKGTLVERWTQIMSSSAGVTTSPVRISSSKSKEQQVDDIVSDLDTILDQKNIKGALDFLDGMKLDPNTMNSSIPFATQIWNTFIESIKLSIKAGNSVQKAFEIAARKLMDSDSSIDKNDMRKAANFFSKSTKKEINVDFLEDAVVEDEVVEDEIVVEDEVVEDEVVVDEIVEPAPKKQKTKEKSLEKNVLKSKGTPKTTKQKLKALGIDYDVEGQDLAIEDADKIISEVGLEEAYKETQGNFISGGRRTVIEFRMQEELTQRLADAITDGNQTLQEELEVQLAAIYAKHSEVYREKGRELAMINRMYRISSIKFEVNSSKKKWEQEFGKEMPVDVQKRMEKLEKTIKKQADELEKLEKERGKEDEQQAVQNIKEVVERQKKKPRVTKRKKVEGILSKLDAIEKKLISQSYSDPTLVISTIVTGIKAIKVSVKTYAATVDAIQDSKIKEIIAEGIKNIKKKLKSIGENLPNEAELRQDIEDLFTDAPDDVDIDQKDIKIPKGLLYDLVKGGKDNINDLTNAVKDAIKDDYPNATKREVRDAITRYGLQVNKPKDSIKKILSSLKIDGSLLSKLEDLLDGKRPKKRKGGTDYTEDQLKKIKEIRRRLKTLPIDDSADKEGYYKSALSAYKTRLQNRINELNEAIKENKLIENENVSLELDTEAKRLKAELEIVNKEYSEKFKDSDEVYQTKVKSVEKAKKTRLRKLRELREDLIQEGKEKTKETKRAVKSKEITQIDKQIKQAQEEYNQVLEDIGIAEAKRISRALNHIEKRKQYYRDKLRNKDFSKRNTKPLTTDPQIAKAKQELLKEKNAYMEEFSKFERKNRNIAVKAIEALLDMMNMPKGLLATNDLSAPGRQGIFLGASNPAEYKNAFIEMHKAAFSNANYERFMASIENSKYFNLMMEAGLEITDTSGELSKTEEMFISNIIKTKIKIKGKNVNVIGMPVAASERAYVTFLNSLRSEVFIKGVKLAEDNPKMGITPATNPKFYKDLAKMINYSTGRGALTNNAIVDKTLNLVFFSPRMITGMFGLTIMTLNPNTDKYTRMQALKGVAGFLAYQAIMKGLFTLTIAAIKEAGLGDDEEVEVLNFEITDTDFGKVRYGDTSYDPTGGWAVLLRTFARFAWGTKSVNGKDIPLDDGYMRSSFDDLMNTTRNKFSPIARQAYNWKTGQHPTDFTKDREDATAFDYFQALAMPLSNSGLMEDAQRMHKGDKGATAAKMTLNFLANTYGTGSTTYDRNQFKKEKPKGKPMTRAQAKMVMSPGELKEFDAMMKDMNAMKNKISKMKTEISN